MAKQTIRPEEMGEFFFEIYKNSFPIEDVINHLKDFFTEAEFPSDEVMSVELDYLQMYIISKAVHIRFPSHKDVFRKNFLEKTLCAIQDYLPEELANRRYSDFLDAMVEYATKEKEIDTHLKRQQAQIEFGRYISNRVVGDNSGDELPLVMYFYSLYAEYLLSIIDLIDTSVEIIE